MNSLPTSHALRALACLGAALAGMNLARAGDSSATEQLAHWRQQAGGSADAQRGRVLFDSRHGGNGSCASCHGSPPTAEGKHASTGKAMAPLAPAFNPKAFTDRAKSDKWFHRNCKDVLARECSAQEKADLLAYLVQLK